MALPENGFIQPVEIVVASTLPRNGYVQPVEVVAGPGVITGGGVAGQVAYFDGPTSITGNASLTYVAGTGALTIAGSLTLSALTPTHVLYAGTGGLVSGSANHVWDNANSLLKLSSGSALQIATVDQPCRIFTGYYTNFTIDDPYISLGYNTAGGIAVTSNPITAGKVQQSISLENNWSPAGTYTQVEFNHDYWSADGLTHRRGFLHQIRNDTYVGAWNWFADTFFWANSSNSATFLTMSNTYLTYSGSTVSIGTPIATGSTNFVNNSSNPTTILNCTAAAANSRLWDTFLSGTTLEYRLVDDGITAASDWARITRSANVATAINFYGTEWNYYAASADANSSVKLTAGVMELRKAGSGTVLGKLSCSGTSFLLTTDAGSATDLDLGVNTSANWRISAATGGFAALSNLRFSHGTSALATTATEGYMFMQSCAGDPTGVPASIPTGQKAWQYNSTAKTLWLYDGAWVKAKVAGVDVVFA